MPTPPPQELPPTPPPAPEPNPEPQPPPTSTTEPVSTPQSQSQPQRKKRYKTITRQSRDAKGYMTFEEVKVTDDEAEDEPEPPRASLLPQHSQASSHTAHTPTAAPAKGKKQAAAPTSQRGIASFFTRK